MATHIPVRQSTARTIFIPVPFVDVVDGSTPLTTLTLGGITAAVVKRGAASDTVTRSTFTPTASGGANDFVHVGDGYWKLELTSSQTDTVGQLSVTLRDDDVFMPVSVNCWVYEEVVFDAIAAGTDMLHVNLEEIEEVALSSGGASLVLDNITLSSSSVALSVTSSGSNAAEFTGSSGGIAVTGSGGTGVAVTGGAGAGMTLSGAGVSGHALRLVAAGASGFAVNVSQVQSGNSSDGVFPADATKISGDATAADTLESYCDGGANIPADIVKIAGTASYATTLGYVVLAAPSFTVDDASFTPTTTAFDTDATEATNDHYNGRRVVFITGALAGQETDITDYDGTNKRFTVTAMTEAPADGDRFIVV